MQDPSMGALMIRARGDIDGVARAVGSAQRGFEAKTLEVHRGVAAAQGSNGALDAKTREQIAIAVAVATRCDSCFVRMRLRRFRQAPPKKKTPMHAERQSH